MQSLPMNPGEGSNSYAKNSLSQRVIQQSLHYAIEQAVTELFQHPAPPPAIGMADCGCGTGPNALLLLSTAVNAVQRARCQEPQNEGPELLLYLNDLPSNDFATVFKRLPGFLAEVTDKCRVQGRPPKLFVAPGSFYGQLFQASSMHLICSSSALHWLSEVPPELNSIDSSIINYRSITVGRTSPPAAVEAYTKQFKKDFTSFLTARAAEIVPRGWLTLAFSGKMTEAQYYDNGRYSLDFVDHILDDMVSRGVIEREKLDRFNMPVYCASCHEACEIINEQGCFEVVRAQSERTELSTLGPSTRARDMRAVMEQFMEPVFGKVMDEFVESAEKVFAIDEEHNLTTIIIALRRRS